MKVKINGIEREVQIVQAPKGAFCCLEGLASPSFPLFVCFCEAITDEETNCGDILICPIFDFNLGYSCVSAEEVKIEVYLCDLILLLKNYCSVYGEVPLRKAVKCIMDDFKSHGTIISEGVNNYVAAVMSGSITDFPVMNDKSE